MSPITKVFIWSAGILARQRALGALLSTKLIFDRENTEKRDCARFAARMPALQADHACSSATGVLIELIICWNSGSSFKESQAGFRSNQGLFSFPKAIARRSQLSALSRSPSIAYADASQYETS